MSRIHPTPQRYGVQPPPLRQQPAPSPDEQYPWLPKLAGVIGLLLVILLLWRFCYEPPLPNVGKLRQPIQTKLPKPIALPSYPGYKVWGTHTYDIKALILSRKTYSENPGAMFSPVDFALGWGVVTMAPYVNAIKWSQRGRWFNFRYGANFPLSSQHIYLNAANTHIIPHPKKPDLREQILDFDRGDLVRLKGYLVVIRANKGGWRWVSSKSRTDKGGGACEVMYVTEAQKLPIR